MRKSKCRFRKYNLTLLFTVEQYEQGGTVTVRPKALKSLFL